MSGQGVASGEAPITLRTYVRPLTSMELGVALQIMQSPKAGIAGITAIRLLMTMSGKMTFEIVVPGEIGITVRAFVSFGGW